LAQYGEVTGVETDSRAFTESLKAALLETAEASMPNFPKMPMPKSSMAG
jgi:hypothetical protein